MKLYWLPAMQVMYKVVLVYLSRGDFGDFVRAIGLVEAETASEFVGVAAAQGGPIGLVETETAS
jgi:hypothetical protein